MCENFFFDCHYPANWHYQAFATSLKGYETTIFKTLSVDELTTTYQKLLGVGTDNQVVLWRPKSNLSNIDCSRICSVISAYRLLDVVAMLKDVHPAPTVERQFYEVPNTSFRVSTFILNSSTLKCP
jgi:hypothetical protein